MVPENYDFSGWATRNDLQCSDGRVIRRDAFKGNDGTKVPLVFAHQHTSTENVLGHAILENREEGVYAYGFFNETESGKAAKEQVRHGDITTLSIFANRLKEIGNDVIHGVIREVSLVLAGANPGAFIDNVMVHGDDGDNAMIIGYDEGIDLAHADDTNKDKSDEEPAKDSEEKPAEEPAEKTIQQIIDTMNEEQQNATYALVEMVIEEYDNQTESGGDNNMRHNLFEGKNAQGEGATLSHDQMATIIADAKRNGSLKEAFLAHADYGVTNIDYLFPDAKTLNATPEFISRQMSWVSVVMNGVHHTPFSRIKSIFADITENDARAKGYLKGNLKTEEVFTLLKRTTTPTTIYKKQKLDRDDIIDITDFDVVAWLKTEMRMMLDEEIARAILVGDGRLSSSDDKINEGNIRPIWKDEELYTIPTVVQLEDSDTEDSAAKKIIKSIIKARKNYKGSGNPSLFTTEDFVTDCLLLEDGMGRRLYNTVTDLATALRVSSIVTVEVMEGLTRTVNAKERSLIGIVVNLVDYNVGADKGGAVNMFDDFDIDYNQQKYLIETRCSGALVKPFSAIVIETTPAVVG